MEALIHVDQVCVLLRYAILSHMTALPRHKACCMYGMAVNQADPTDKHDCAEKIWSYALGIHCLLC